MRHPVPLGEPAWVAWARALPQGRWNQWHDRAHVILAEMPPGGSDG